MNKPMYERIEYIETKECVACYQLIDSRASRCPHCCSYLEKSPRARLRQLKVIILLLVVVAISGWLAFWLSDRTGELVVLGPSSAERGPVLGEKESIELAPAKEPNLVAQEETVGELEDTEKTEETELLPNDPEFLVQTALEYDPELVERVLSCSGNLITNVSCEIYLDSNLVRSWPAMNY